MTITGPGASSLTVSGAKAYDVFTVNSGTTVSISGLTIANGNSGSSYGGGILNNGSLTVSNSTFSGNTATSSGYGGGGIASFST